jgi:hypothetical protein
MLKYSFIPIADVTECEFKIISTKRLFKRLYVYNIYIINKQKKTTDPGLTIFSSKIKKIPKNTPELM